MMKRIGLCLHAIWVWVRGNKKKKLSHDTPTLEKGQALAGRGRCRSVYTVSDKHLRHGGSGYETNGVACTFVGIKCL